MIPRKVIYVIFNLETECQICYTMEIVSFKPQKLKINKLWKKSNLFVEYQKYNENIPFLKRVLLYTYFIKKLTKKNIYLLLEYCKTANYFVKQ